MPSRPKPLTALGIDPEKICILARLEVKVAEASQERGRKHEFDPVFPQLAGKSLLPCCQFHAVQYMAGMRDEQGVRVTAVNGSVRSCNLLIPSVIGHLAKLARLGIEGRVKIFFPSKREGLENRGVEAAIKWRARIEPDIDEENRDHGKRSVEFESIAELIVHAAALAADMEALGAEYFADVPAVNNAA